MWDFDSDEDDDGKTGSSSSVSSFKHMVRHRSLYRSKNMYVYTHMQQNENPCVIFNHMLISFESVHVYISQCVKSNEICEYQRSVWLVN